MSAHRQPASSHPRSHPSLVWESGETSLVRRARDPLLKPMLPSPVLTSWGSSHMVAAGAAGSRRLPARPSADSPGSRCAACRLQGQPSESRPSGSRTSGSGSWHSAWPACTPDSVDGNLWRKGPRHQLSWPRAKQCLGENNEGRDADSWLARFCQWLPCPPEWKSLVRGLGDSHREP